MNNMNFFCRTVRAYEMGAISSSSLVYAIDNPKYWELSKLKGIKDKYIMGSPDMAEAICELYAKGWFNEVEVVS